MKQIIWILIIFTVLGRESLSAELGSQKIAALRRRLEACDSHKKRLIESDLAAQSKNAEAQKKLKIMHTLLNEVCDAEEKSGRASAACERYRLHCARETTKNKQEYAKLSKEIAALDKKLPELRNRNNEFIASRERTLAECAHAIGNS